MRAGDRIETETGTNFLTPNERRIWSETLDLAERALSPKERQTTRAVADKLTPETVCELIASLAGTPTSTQDSRGVVPTAD